MGRYDGKRVVITGGSAGIGLATAQLLIDEGARVLITGRTRATLDAAALGLGERATAVVSDASSLTDIDALVDRARAELGGVDLLFVNAGTTRWTKFDEVDETQFDEIFALNTRGPFFLVQRMAPLLAEGGAVVLTTSVVDVMGYPLVSVYAASKAALRSLTRSLARAVAFLGFEATYTTGLEIPVDGGATQL